MEKELLINKVLITIGSNKVLNRTRFYLDQVFRCLYWELVDKRESYFRNAWSSKICATKALENKYFILL